MIKFFSILALTFLFIPIERSNADYDWIPFNDEDENVISYIDMNSIERVDDIIYYWLLLDYKEPQTLKSKPNRTVLSTIGYRQLFCNQMGRRSVRSEFYSEKMGKGELIEEYDYPYDYPINHYKPSEKGYQYWSNVCDNTKNACPIFIGNSDAIIHKNFIDPANALGSEKDIINEFREIRDLIKVWIDSL